MLLSGFLNPLPAPGDPAWQGILPGGLLLSDQGKGDLGRRLARAARRAIAGGEAVLLIGTDCPELTAGRLRAAAEIGRAHV